MWMLRVVRNPSIWSDLDENERRIVRQEFRQRYGKNSDDVRWTPGQCGTFSADWIALPNKHAVRRLMQRTLHDQNRCEADERLEVKTEEMVAYRDMFYEITARSGVLCAKVIMPTYAHHKTTAEVATITFLSQMTTIPVPRIVAHDATRKNAIGHEWILFENFPGEPVPDMWRRMSYESKCTFITELAGIMSELYNRRKSTIGSLALEQTALGQHDLPVVGRLQDEEFYDHGLDEAPVPHGPYANAYYWLKARLAMNRRYQRAVVRAARKQRDRYFNSLDLLNLRRWRTALYEAEELLTVLENRDIDVLLRRLFRNPSGPWRATIGFTCLCNPDIEESKIFVDAAGHITCIPFWDRACFLPTKYVWRWPALIDVQELPDRLAPPDPARYAYPNQPGVFSPAAAAQFRRHQAAWEQTSLRQRYREAIRAHHPDWDVPTNDNLNLLDRLRRDFVDRLSLPALRRDLADARRWIQNALDIDVAAREAAAAAAPPIVTEMPGGYHGPNVPGVDLQGPPPPYAAAVLSGPGVPVAPAASAASAAPAVTAAPAAPAVHAAPAAPAVHAAPAAPAATSAAPPAPAGTPPPRPGVIPGLEIYDVGPL